MGYVGAPYNFVSLSKDVYNYAEDKQIKHDVITKEGLTGEIVYEITAKTPIMVDNGNGEFYRNAEGKEVIPGSTMRGLIRNNVQILGLASVNDDVDDYLLMYREVGKPSNNQNKKRYDTLLGVASLNVSQRKKQKSISVLKNVKAGYIKNEHGTYYIYQTKVDSIKKELGGMNYYVLSERKIIESYLEKRYSEFDFFFSDPKHNFLQHRLEKFEKRIDRNNRIHWVGKSNKFYVPYCKAVSYEVKNLKDIVKVREVGKCSNKGYAVSTGKMNEKKAIYIIPEIDMSKERIEISQEDLKAFQIDYKKRESTLGKNEEKKSFDLPEEGKMKPVFYIYLDGRLYFGFTPRLRLFYEHSIKHGLNDAHKKCGLDYATAMFGYSRASQSFKSKLSFSDAVVQGDCKRLGARQLIQAEPKPTSYLDYLKQTDNSTNTYNQSDFELRGVKQYWLHRRLNQERMPDNQKNFAEQFKAFSPLAEDTKFVGKVRFQNLTEDELGLLLWSIKLNSGSQMNVGKAKAYGYGRVEVKIRETKVVDLEKAYATLGALVLNPYKLVDVEKMILCYKETINRFLKNRKIDELAHIKEFFMMKDSQHIPSESDIRYMSIQAPIDKSDTGFRGKNTINEYQERKGASLPKVDDIYKAKKK